MVLVYSAAAVLMFALAALDVFRVSRRRRQRRATRPLRSIKPPARWPAPAPDSRSLDWPLECPRIDPGLYSPRTTPTDPPEAS